MKTEILLDNEQIELITSFCQEKKIYFSRNCQIIRIDEKDWKRIVEELPNLFIPRRIGKFYGVDMTPQL